MKGTSGIMRSGIGQRGKKSGVDKSIDYWPSNSLTEL